MSRDARFESTTDLEYSPAAESEDGGSPEPEVRRGRASLPPRPSLLPRPARLRPSSRRKTALRAEQRGQGRRRATAVERTPASNVDELVTRQLLTEYAPLVRQIVGGFQRKLPRNILREDLIGAGMGGLWDAIRRQGDKRGESFEWYVRVRIRGAILDELRAQDWLPRRARANIEESGKGVMPSVVRFDEISDWEKTRCMGVADETNSEAAVHAKFTREALVQAIEQLPERERHIVAAHYFLGVKFKDLGTELGVSEPRISQLHSRAMQRLKTIMASQSV